eukprot:CAMPEP_0117858366 /NCGR_PEP_ID=MMETSP0950-20121206/2468_1 /TAXON_ID=44440 /ORGANISM="Chattonella subsalsa, Strain CCMP2191" /LENGTH=118 /DNA_ID=CAMNT_0005707981 /DNA_START=52 /DNA_END=408 /DNA_ORIENTATION=+
MMSEISESQSNSGSKGAKRLKKLLKDPNSKKAKVLRAVVASKMARYDGEPCQIGTLNLFIGSVGAASQKDRLLGMGITHILRACDWGLPDFPENFSYMTVPIEDHPFVHRLNRVVGTV